MPESDQQREFRWEREDSQSVLLDRGKLRRLLIRHHVPAGRGRDTDMALARKVVREFLEQPRHISSVECDALIREWVGP